MVRHYKMGIFAYKESVIIESPPSLQGVYLIYQYLGIDNYTVPDYAPLVRMQDAGRYKVQNGLFSIHNYGMAGIVPSLKADDKVCIFAEYIDDLTFTLVSPLCAYDNYIRHSKPPNNAF